VTFLLRPAELEPTEVHEKERLIQSGARHYSEMISFEPEPPADYLELFTEVTEQEGPRLAADVARLAKRLRQSGRGPSALISLARAGTPIGVLLRRALARLGWPAPHYSVSIIRDRGIDEVALEAIRAEHDPDGWLFIDGWTGKGAIQGELDRAWAAYAERHGVSPQRPPLAVVADLAGVADLSATPEDYLIPCSILNAAVSGLISRSILNEELVAPGQFHACVLWEHLRPVDRSRWFVDRLEPALRRALKDPGVCPAFWGEHERQRMRRVSLGCVETLRKRYAVADVNRIKPGIGESTRALLRRVPERLILADEADPSVRHLHGLARSRNAEIDLDPSLPYRAAAIIRSLGRD
jgi:hypothetical protein